MNDRLIKLMQHLNLSPSLFADEIGVNRPAISHIMSGRNKPGVELIQKVLKRFPEVSTDWLLMGTGSMLLANSPQQTIVKSAEPVTPKSEQIDLLSYIEKESNTRETTPKSQPEKAGLALGANQKGQIKRITVYFSDGSFKDFIEDN